MKRNTAIFLDRDGTINKEVSYLDSLDRLIIFPEAFEAIRLINLSGLKAVIITNQSGIARGLFTEAFVKQTHEYLQEAFKQRGAAIDAFYYCPHHPTEGNEPYRRICDCRKPKTGLLHQAAADMDIDLAASYLIGDRFQDIETAHNAGAKGILVMTGYGQDLIKQGGPDQANEANRPDHIAQNILDAVRWILKDRG